jgi:hypothetical protein
MSSTPAEEYRARVCDSPFHDLPGGCANPDCFKYSTRAWEVYSEAERLGMDFRDHAEEDWTYQSHEGPKVMRDWHAVLLHELNQPHLTQDQFARVCWPKMAETWPHHMFDPLTIGPVRNAHGDSGVSLKLLGTPHAPSWEQ